MQTINGFLKTNGVTAVWCDRNGQTAETPSITVGMCCRFRIAIFRDEIDENGVLVPVSFEEMQSVSYYIALDSDYLQETDPKLVNVSGCSLERDPETGGAVFVCEIPNTAVPSLLDHIQEEEQLTLDMEIGGFEEANDVAVFVTQTTLLVRNRIWLGGTPPSDVAEDPEYWNAAQIQAYLSQTPQIQTSADGESWHDDVDTEHDRWWRWRFGANGLWTEAYPLLRGADGESFLPDQIGTLAERPASPENGFCYVATDTNLCYWYLSGAWSPGVTFGRDGTDGKDGTNGTNGKDGADGKNAYEVAVTNGFSGTVSEWLDSLRGADGEDGADIQPDATGSSLSELDAYADKPAGFIFAASVINTSEHYTDVYYYAKKTDDYNNWCNPLVKRIYGGKDGEDGEGSKLIPPLEFSAPENETDNIFIISTTAQKYPYAHIAQVTIDTQDGELVLPYNSAAGVEKIIRASNGDIKIYFGSLVPEFETGRIYWAQASYPETAFLDAPMDGNFYCRRNGQWVAVAVQALGSVTISGTQEYNENLTVGKNFSLTFDAIASNGSAVEIELTSGTLPAGLALNGKTISGTPSAEGTASLVFTASADGATMRISVELTIAKQLIMYLGHVASTSEIYKVADITEAMLNAETVTGAPAGTLDKTSLGDASPGDMDFVLLPKEANLKALKFDGISGWLEFEENKGGVSGSGANGTEITLNGEQYLVYGEIRLIAGETFIKVEEI